MKREEKEQLVQVLHDELDKSQAVFVTDYMGLNVERITKLRRDISGAGGSYQVVKNTLLRRASEGTPVTGIGQFFTGPTAIAIAHSDAVAVAKTLVNFAKDNEQLEIQGGILGERPMTAADIQELAKMPPREVLLARMLGSLNAPVSNFVGVLAAIVSQLVYVLKAIENKKREGV
ncbi:MAG TPA: 50S ribosomal protein L10 [Deltaproteobacteria bacterium]|nr:50S ribosomal protein L10 [Deltaproteobacteria bacterium]OQC28301.1 MAG: 50S ribosomal protein L10 [Deltaproteobacteria bacterium ADurb.Bin072]HRW80950.1 50S ribosomal protein L10 [Desulfomonilia bacterium]HNQ86701.1 50S ribosomal protein L10 [Deltaproteobacteria bacterium]HNS90982.1 50S ribosomal protein L10 [Deltaproteobacteria bacterium]